MDKWEWISGRSSTISTTGRRLRAVKGGRGRGEEKTERKNDGRRKSGQRNAIMKPWEKESHRSSTSTTQWRWYFRYKRWRCIVIARKREKGDYGRKFRGGGEGRRREGGGRGGFLRCHRSWKCMKLLFRCVPISMRGRVHRSVRPSIRRLVRP